MENFSRYPSRYYRQGNLFTRAGASPAPTQTNQKRHCEYCSTAPTAGPSCISAPAIPTKTTARIILSAPITRATPAPAKSTISGNRCFTGSCWRLSNGHWFTSVCSGRTLRWKCWRRTRKAAKQNCGGKAESPLRGEEADGGFRQDYPAHL